MHTIDRYGDQPAPELDCHTKPQLAA